MYILISKISYDKNLLSCIMYWIIDIWMFLNEIFFLTYIIKSTNDVSMVSSNLTLSKSFSLFFPDISSLFSVLRSVESDVPTFLILIKSIILIKT